MTHELRTPLAAIPGYAELIQKGFMASCQRSRWTASPHLLQRQHLLINAVLDIAKIEPGEFSLNLGECALENVVETVRAAAEALAKQEAWTALSKHMRSEQNISSTFIPDKKCRICDGRVLISC